MTRVLTDERRSLILDRLHTHGRVLAADLTAELAVSADTIRRDLRELDDAGLLRRVHGGALPRHGDAAPFATRARRAPEARPRSPAARPPVCATGWSSCSMEAPPRSSSPAHCAATCGRA